MSSLSLRPMVMVAENQAKIRTSLHMQFPTMSTEDNTAQRNLKFKITTKGIRKDSEYKSRDNTVKLLENKGQRDRVTGSGNKLSEVKVLAKPSMPMKSCKRRPEESLDGQRGKKRKMDRNLQLQCGNILKELMNHQAGWIFNEPVDPVKWNIPDYFSIITEPMDLGTIKRKLAGNMYFGAEEFATDVKLTFSNAMAYNAPGHEVHEFAKEMNGNFCRRWKSLEAKLQHKNTNVEKAFFVHHMDGRATKQTVENNQDRKPTVLKKAPLRKVKPSLRNTVQKEPCGRNACAPANQSQSVDSTQAKCSSCGSLTCHCRLKNSSAHISTGESCGRSACAPANQSQSVDSTRHKCSSCGRLTCHCRLKNSYAQASSSDLSSERSSEHNHCGDSKLDCEVKCPMAFRRSSFSLDSEGPGVVFDEEKSPHLSTPATTASSVEGWTSFSVQMSPKKALRAAMLKSRFADTIFKATHQVEKSDPLRMQQERERLEREKQEEKTRIEAEIKAAEAASQRREQSESKMRRERERAAARIALQKMQKSVEIYENLNILKDLEMFCCYSPSGVKGVHRGSPLERLGLYLKEDYLEEDEDIRYAVLNGEEGEILS